MSNERTIRELCDENERLCATIADQKDVIRDMEDRLAAQAATIADLTAALAPFARCWDLRQCEMPEERMLMFASEGGGTFMGFAQVRHLKEASAALARAQGEKE